MAARARPQRDYPPDFYHRDAADMFALMDSLGYERFSVMGWSDGANVGAIMAALRPERVERLVVFGGQSFLTPEDIATFKAIRKISDWAPKPAATMRGIYGAELDGLWDRYVAGQELLFDMGGDLYGLLLAKVRCPVMVLHGGKDPLVPLFQAEAIARGLADAELRVFPERPPQYPHAPGRGIQPADFRLPDRETGLMQRPDRACSRPLLRL